jgi:hypothetical protein
MGYSLGGSFDRQGWNVPALYDLDFSDASRVQRVSLWNAQSLPIELGAAAGAYFNLQARFLQGLIQRPPG